MARDIGPQGLMERQRQQRIPVLRASLLMGRTPVVRGQLVEAFLDAWETGVLSPARLRTGCLYERQPADTYCLAAMRFDPRATTSRRLPQLQSWLPVLAPSAALLRGYRTKDRWGARAVPWYDFAQRYLAELDALPAMAVMSLLEALGSMPSHYRTVTLLCCEHAPGGDETQVRCHRRLLRSWLLGEAIAETVAPRPVLIGTHSVSTPAVQRAC